MFVLNAKVRNLHHTICISPNYLMILIDNAFSKEFDLDFATQKALEPSNFSK
jgi:hypothetical protein